MRVVKIIVVCLAVFGLVRPVAVAEPTSENNPRLQKALERFPQADGDGDGVLTMSEARAFREARGKGKKEKPAQATAGGPEPTLENVSYGPHESNVLDFWKAASDRPTPVVVFIHGGGFKGGDKTKVRENPAVIGKCLASGVSFAAINYRYLEHAPLPDVLRDTARAIQFMRHKADEWNIDKTRIASYGGSAGAGASLWLGSHDDLADPGSADPVLRESSRLAVVGATGCQFTYDLLQWPDVVGEYTGDRDQNQIHLMYGLASVDELYTEKGRKIRADVDMRGLLSPDDPPVYLHSAQPNTEPVDHGHYVHHPRHAIAIKDRCDALGIETIMILKGSSPPGKKPADVMLDFFFKHMQVESRMEPERVG